MLYRVEKLEDCGRVLIGMYKDIESASIAIDLDTKQNGADIVYYVERED